MSDERYIPTPVDGALLGRNIIKNGGVERENGLGIDEFFGETGYVLRHSVNPRIMGIQPPSYDRLSNEQKLTLKMDLSRGITLRLREVWDTGISEIENSEEPVVKDAAREAYRGDSEMAKLTVDLLPDSAGKSVIKAISYLTRIRILQALRAELAAQGEVKNDFQIMFIDRQIEDCLAVAATILALETREPITALFEDVRLRANSLRDQS